MSDKRNKNEQHFLLNRETVFWVLFVYELVKKRYCKLEFKINGLLRNMARYRLNYYYRYQPENFRTSWKSSFLQVCADCTVCRKRRLIIQFQQWVNVVDYLQSLMPIIACCSFSCLYYLKPYSKSRQQLSLICSHLFDLLYTAPRCPSVYSLFTIRAPMRLYTSAFGVHIMDGYLSVSIAQVNAICRPKALITADKSAACSFISCLIHLCEIQPLYALNQL